MAAERLAVTVERLGVTVERLAVTVERLARTVERLGVTVERVAVTGFVSAQLFDMFQPNFLVCLVMSFGID